VSLLIGNDTTSPGGRRCSLTRLAKLDAHPGQPMRSISSSRLRGVTMADPHRPLWLPELHLLTLCAKLSAKSAESWVDSSPPLFDVDECRSEMKRLPLAKEAPRREIPRSLRQRHTNT